MSRQFFQRLLLILVGLISLLDFSNSQGFIYPLDIGTRWSWTPVMGSGVGIYSVMKDTNLPNGLTYSVISPFPFGDADWNARLERRFQDRVYRYLSLPDSECLWFDFSRHAGDTINHNPNIILDRIWTDTLFGISRRTFSFLYDPEPLSIDDESTYFVTDSIGVSFILWSNGVWRLKGAQIGDRIYGIITEATHLPAAHPLPFSLQPIYPSPFNTSANIKFTLAQATVASIQIYDVLGRIVATPADQFFPPGEQVISFNADNLPSGVYLCRMSVKGQCILVRMILMK